MSIKKRTAEEAGLDTQQAPAPLQAQAQAQEELLVTADAAAAAAAAEPVAEEQQPVPKKESEEVIYPKDYSKFDPNNIVFPKDPQPSSDGSGEFIYMNYIYPNGVQGQLLIQTPNNMFIAGGVKTFADGKSSCLISFGDGWETSNPLIVEFNEILKSIRNKCIGMIIARKWMHPYKADAVAGMVEQIARVGTNKKTGESYSPAISASVSMDGMNRASFYQVINDKTVRMSPMDVTMGSAATSIINLQWVFRKSARNSWAFSIKPTLKQAVIFLAPAGGVESTACNIVL